MTLETETPRVRSRRGLKRCCGVSPRRFMTVTVSKLDVVPYCYILSGVSTTPGENENETSRV